ncbi:glutamate racemase [Aquabacterium sp. A08]|uniref:glutamate racemase n=1 Tax=Aquabacterium sp. A08 TaxID=2718532 RepID=UPI001421E432|nr:glutamate racemase [Aquabacterium sp. A08]NIC43079.1 glutamate racemase [Aquabacterium sp. A08]
MTAPAAPASATPAGAPIGVFDSGVGGLSVLREIRALLPGETLHYLADSGHAPYGDKTPAYVQARAEALVQALLAQGCKAVVVACNTVTGLSIRHLRERFPNVPIVAIEPAVKPAAAQTRSGVVGVLATRNTVHSPGLARLVAEHAHGVRVLAQACPGWVERVERGELDGPDTEAAVAEHLAPLLAQHADTLVLGCTHYPFLRPVIERVAGPGVAVLDPSAAVARELARRLEALRLRNPAGSGSERFWSSGDLARAAQVMGVLWPQPVAVERLAEPTEA